MQAGYAVAHRAEAQASWQFWPRAQTGRVIPLWRALNFFWPWVRLAHVHNDFSELSGIFQGGDSGQCWACGT